MMKWALTLLATFCAAFATPSAAANRCEEIDRLVRVEQQSMQVLETDVDAAARRGAMEIDEMLDRVDWQAMLRLGPSVDAMAARSRLLAYARSRWALASAVRASGAAGARPFVGDAAFAARAIDLRVLAAQLGCAGMHAPPTETFLHRNGMSGPLVYGALGVALTAISLVTTVLTYYREIENRFSRRRNCSVELEVKIDSLTYVTEMVDVGRNGAKIRAEGVNGLAPKRKLDLILNDERHRARVIWSNKHYAGLMFARPLGADEVEQAMGVSLRGASVDPLRGGANVIENQRMKPE